MIDDTTASETKLELNKTMRAIVATEFGDPSRVLELREEIPVPVPDLEKGEMLVKVLSMSLSPGDLRMLSGEASLLKKPKAWPYIPGLDVCGQVVQVGASSTFKVGDVVIGTWDMFGVGGLAEYAIVKSKLAVLKPNNMDVNEAAALANSSSHAMQAAKKASISKGDRVLILGGSGGVGTLLIQLAKTAGASFVACTSTQGALTASIGADRTIDYTTTDWSKVEEFKADKFDVIIDCAEGIKGFNKSRSVLKSNGIWVAVVWNEWDIFIRNPFQAAGFFFTTFGRFLGKKLNPFVPKYRMHLGGADANSMTKVLDAVNNGEMKAIVDSRGPFPFTLEGVQEAFKILQDRQGHGKIVIQVAEA